MKYTICTTLYLLHENMTKIGFIHRNKRVAGGWWEWIFQEALILRILMLVWKKTYWKFIIHLSYIDLNSYILSQRTPRGLSFVAYEGKLKIDNF